MHDVCQNQSQIALVNSFAVIPLCVISEVTFEVKFSTRRMSITSQRSAVGARLVY